MPISDSDLISMLGCDGAQRSQDPILTLRSLILNSFHNFQMHVFFPSLFLKYLASLNAFSLYPSFLLTSCQHNSVKDALPVVVFLALFAAFCLPLSNFFLKMFCYLPILRYNFFCFNVWYFLCSTVNKTWVAEMCKSLHSVFIYIIS